MPEGGARTPTVLSAFLSSMKKEKTAEGAVFSLLNWHSGCRCTHNTRCMETQSQDVLGSHAWEAQSFVCLLHVWGARQRQEIKETWGERWSITQTLTCTFWFEHNVSQNNAWCLVAELSLKRCQFFSLATICFIVILLSQTWTSAPHSLFVAQNRRRLQIALRLNGWSEPHRAVPLTWRHFLGFRTDCTS